MKELAHRQLTIESVFGMAAIYVIMQTIGTLSVTVFWLPLFQTLGCRSRMLGALRRRGFLRIAFGLQFGYLVLGFECFVLAAISLDVQRIDWQFALINSTGFLFSPIIISCYRRYMVGKDDLVLHNKPVVLILLLFKLVASAGAAKRLGHVQFYLETIFCHFQATQLTSTCNGTF